MDRVRLLENRALTYPRTLVIEIVVGGSSLSRHGVLAGTMSPIENMARTLIATGKAFGLGLTELCLVACENDPHGAWGDMGTTYTVDEWLNLELKPELLFELAAITGRDDLVRVTPWHRALGPLAFLSLDLPKAAIAAVRPATYSASPARLVDLDFRPDSMISLQELYSKLRNPVAS